MPVVFGQSVDVEAAGYTLEGLKNLGWYTQGNTDTRRTIVDCAAVRDLVVNNSGIVKTTLSDVRSLDSNGKAIGKFVLKIVPAVCRDDFFFLIYEQFLRII